MKIGEVLYFSPSFRFNELSWDDKQVLIDAFADRVEGFYLNPAKLLNEKRHGFACGVICVTAIDLIARVVTGEKEVGPRIEKWLRGNIKGFDKSNLAHRFYTEFRNGLVHEGRIKNLGQFSYETGEVVSIQDGIMSINPKLLRDELTIWFKRYLQELRHDNKIFEDLKRTLVEDFGPEVNRAKSLS